MNFDQVEWGTPVRLWLVGIAVALCVFVCLLLIRRRVVHWLARRSVAETFGVSLVAETLVRTVSTILLFAFSIYGGSLVVHLNHTAAYGLSVLVRLSLFFQMGLVGQAVIDLLVKHARRRAQDGMSASAMMGFSLLGKVTLWIVLILVSLENLGVNMTTLIASLGIGGIAVGLAMQRVVGDLIASLAIVLDRPFTHGDFIAIDSASGTVEKIGLKTTRIRALSGEELVVPNADLIQGRIHNYRSLQERRIVLTLGVTYDTPADQLEAIPRMIQGIIEKQEHVRFDRAHFKAISVSSLDFEAVYYVTSSDYVLYMNIQQAINLALLRKFTEEHIHLAIPTQTVYLHPALPTVSSLDGR